MPRKNGSEEKKVRIIDALNVCLQKKPFDQTSIKDIARAAGVNHGLLHYYFKNKEDILLHYIDHVIGHYKSVFTEWLASEKADQIDEKRLIADLFAFMNEKITLNRPLSKVFIEIWEIALYNEKVRERLKAAYGEWINTLAGILGTLTDAPPATHRISAAIVAFHEGMALFSIILDPAAVDSRSVLTGFQKKIIEML